MQGARLHRRKALPRDSWWVGIRGVLGLQRERVGGVAYAASRKARSACFNTTT